ncbi:MAG: hypothetical protein SGARI_000499 [Bacillariaceae sp.]
MSYGKTKKKKAKSKSTKTSKKTSSSEEDAAKLSTKPKKKKKKVKAAEPETPVTTKTKKTKRSTIKKPKSTKKAPESSTDNGFDWEIPVTPVFETPTKAPKKKLSSKEDISELCKRDKENTDNFHNSLDNLFELPAGLMSPVGKVEVNELDQPVISIPDDASHCSDVSSIHSISEYSDDEEDDVSD